MAEWFYRIKGVQEVRGSTWRDEREWTWRPIYTGFIEADSKQHARKLLEEEYGVDLPMRVKKDDIGSKYPYFIAIYPSDPENYYTKELKQVHTCANKDCGKQYTKLEKQIVDDYHGYSSAGTCSSECFEKVRMEQSTTFALEHGGAIPVIYKITNKHTGKCYVGQTTQPFTLRWWQHLQHNSSEKFGGAMSEYSVDSWTFEVIEIVKDQSLLTERERYHIKELNSIENGYNTL